MSYIAFVSTFPNETNMRDGYFRRVHHVDQVFRDENRIHLDIRFGRNLVKKIDRRDDRMKVMHLNAFLHFFLIWSVLKKSGVVYIHSIAKIPCVLVQLMILKRRVPLVLDLHGVMVDERRLAGHALGALFYSQVEKFCFRWCRLTVNVSEVMKNHFRDKYPGYKGEALVFPANSNETVDVNEDPIAQEAVSRQLGFSPGDVIFLYSGNCQKWQNVDLMMEIIKKHTAGNYKFLILSGQKNRFEKLIHHHRISEDSIRVLSVKPEDLWKYYQIAHYGFILRDDILVNRVANPTKLAEYLQYGITPVVKLAEIGDYDQYGYEYIRFKDLNIGLIARKSSKNREVYRLINQQYRNEVVRVSVHRLLS
ncbi:MAG: glycosyltransferase [Bacteroidales bacterium]|jgi:hypothetical protein